MCWQSNYRYFHQKYEIRGSKKVDRKNTDSDFVDDLASLDVQLMRRII